MLHNYFLSLFILSIGKIANSIIIREKNVDIILPQILLSFTTSSGLFGISKKYLPMKFYQLNYTIMC